MGPHMFFFCVRPLGVARTNSKRTAKGTSVPANFPPPDPKPFWKLATYALSRNSGRWSRPVVPIAGHCTHPGTLEHGFYPEIGAGIFGNQNGFDRRFRNVMMFPRGFFVKPHSRPEKPAGERGHGASLPMPNPSPVPESDQQITDPLKDARAVTSNGSPFTTSKVFFLTFLLL